jgi:hypothetical protein
MRLPAARARAGETCKGASTTGGALLHVFTHAFGFRGHRLLSRSFSKGEGFLRRAPEDDEGSARARSRTCSLLIGLGRGSAAARLAAFSLDLRRAPAREP